MTSPGDLRRLAGSFLRITALDGDVRQTLLFRLWTMVAGAVTIILVPTCLSGVEQGYYYTFASLLALQIFFELGLGQVVLQLVSHEVGKDKAAELDELAAMLRRWYSFASTAFFVAVTTGGTWFLSRQEALSLDAWFLPWMLLVLGTALNLYLGSLLAIMEGAGNVAVVARLRLRQSFAGHLLMWCGLAAGSGLWATPLLPLACALFTAFWVGHKAARISARRAPGEKRASVRNWKQEALPLQWRLAISWICGYFCFQLLTPFVFATYGAVEAGRIGITLAIFNAVLHGGMSWVNAKFPAMAMHLARSERPQANHLFRSIAIRAFLFVSVVGLLLLVALSLVMQVAPGLASRFSSLPVAGCLAVATVANAIVFAAAAYLRAHKEEPMLPVSLVWAAGVLAAVSLGARWGLVEMAALYMLVTVAVPLPWTLLLLRKYYRRPA